MRSPACFDVNIWDYFLFKRMNEWIIKINDHRQDIIVIVMFRFSRSRESCRVSKRLSSQDVAVSYCSCRTVIMRFIAPYEIANQVWARIFLPLLSSLENFNGDSYMKWQARAILYLLYQLHTLGNAKRCFSSCFIPVGRGNIRFIDTPRLPKIFHWFDVLEVL